MGNQQLPGNLEVLMLEITLDKTKILLVGLYKPPFLNEKGFLVHLNNVYIFGCTQKYNTEI